MAGIVHKINNKGSVYSIGSTAYFTCSTAAATAAKVATLYADTTATITLVTGLTIHVKFTYTNTATTPTLNINSTGAKPIVKYGTTAPGKTTTTTWYAGAVVSFTYDGTSWVMNDYKYDTDANTDTKVTQTHSTATTPYPILFGGKMDGTTVTDTSYFNNTVYVFPMTGTVYAQEFFGPKFVASGDSQSYSLETDGLRYSGASAGEDESISYDYGNAR